MNFNVITTQYKLEVLEDWQAYKEKILSLLQQAKDRAAHLLLLPEYASIEPAWFYSGSLNHQWEMLQQHLTDYLAFFSSLAQQFSIYIQPGTLPIKMASGNFRNRAYFFNPQGHYAYQDKMLITPCENALNTFSSGNKINVFATPYGNIGIVICYDSEFPALVHELTYKHSVKIILVPSYTDSFHGFHRVHIACRARALEYQCYVVQACARAKVHVCEFLDAIAVGQAGIFAPPDEGFPENGILALGNADLADELVCATLSLEKLDDVRKNGQVHNFHDQSLLEKIQENVTIQTIKF